MHMLQYWCAHSRELAKKRCLELGTWPSTRSFQSLQKNLISRLIDATDLQCYLVLLPACWMSCVGALCVCWTECLSSTSMQLTMSKSHANLHGTSSWWPHTCRQAKDAKLHASANHFDLQAHWWAWSSSCWRTMLSRSDLDRCTANLKLSHTWPCMAWQTPWRYLTVRQSQSSTVTI